MGSVGRMLDWVLRVASLNLFGDRVTVLYPLVRHFICCLVLVQPKKTHPDMTEIVDWDQRIKTSIL